MSFIKDEFMRAEKAPHWTQMNSSDLNEYLYDLQYQKGEWVTLSKQWKVINQQYVAGLCLKQLREGTLIEKMDEASLAGLKDIKKGLAGIKEAPMNWMEEDMYKHCCAVIDEKIQITKMENLLQGKSNVSK